MMQNITYALYLHVFIEFFILNKSHQLNHTKYMEIITIHMNT
ncbi:hypothetical protein C4K37_2947 [Pseudomonas chlororaphis subsp. piscium]|nr:hypothetical protein C4K37_2947 [Pseudomonas chlororaphis subsp. piscium]AZC43882.1 hypothetical protein C4K36_2957 [Pseudomonas chlororaphis subsp. piscium]